MKKHWLPPNHTIIDTDDKSENLYFIIKGSISCYKENTVIKKINPTNMFLEMSLFCEMESEYGYVTETEAIVYQLDYRDIYDILGDLYIKELVQKLFISTVKKSEQMSKFLSHKDLNSFFDLFCLKYYYKDTICSSKDKKLCLVICGRLVVKSTYEIVANPGDLFGEYLFEVKNESLDIISEDECVVFEANWYDALKSLKCNFNNQISIHYCMKLLSGLELFSQISEWKLFQLAEGLKQETFKDKHIILKNGPSSEKLYIIRSGKVRAFIGDFLLKDLEKNESFGDISYIKRNCKPQTFIASGKTECFVLEKEIYEEVVDFTTANPLDKIFESRDITIPLEDLYFLKEIGSGSFGKVFLVHNRKHLFAAKTTAIKACKHQKLLRYYVNEKNVMATLNHPFIVKLVNTFKTNHHLYFLLEYIEGNTISTYMKMRGKDQTRDLKEVQFIGAILLLVVHYLQRMRIIHRDIKPSNCIIDENGYLKLIDFGVAKDMTGKDSTSTLLGTTHYMSPEMILGNGYSFASDYWSIGILLYKYFYGYFPFGNNEKELFQIYDEITEKKLALPYDKKNVDLNNFLTNILNKNPNKRICSLRQAKSQEFYKNFDFDKLLEMKIKSPLKIEFPKQALDFENVSMPLKTYVENELMMMGESDYFSSSKSNEFIHDF